MSYKSFQFVLTLVATNKKNYKDCIAFIQNIFNDRKVSISHLKNLSTLALDIFFTCYLKDFTFMRKTFFFSDIKANVN